jgi:hypothetical protein
MKEILKLKQKGFSLLEIQKLIKPKVSLTFLSIGLRKYCKDNSLEYPKNRAGRKKINLTIVSK